MTHEWRTELGANGTPATYQEDSDGDGTWDSTYTFAPVLGDDGSLSEGCWFEGRDSATRYECMDFGYVDGLIATIGQAWYDADGLVTEETHQSITWYENPVGGPTGGDFTTRTTDASGAVVEGYDTLVWTETERSRSHYDETGTLGWAYDQVLEAVRLP